jgi:hypothetical protein
MDIYRRQQERKERNKKLLAVSKGVPAIPTASSQ